MAKKLYSEIYENAKAWHKSHRDPKTYDDWLRIAHDFSVFSDSEFERELGIAIMNELERVYAGG